MTLPGGADSKLCADSGRYIALRIHWSGHRLQLCSIYMPNQAAAQKQLITSTLGPLAAAAAAAGYQQLWGGDFNFVPSVPLDRLSRNAAAAAAGTQHQDVGTQQRWAADLPDLRDVFRERHPGRCTYTYVHSAHASRLDRFHVSSALLPRAPTCSVLQRSSSDHRPITMALTGLAPASGPGIRRVHLDFLADPALRQQLQDWLDLQLPIAPADHHSLLLWWPQFKRRLAAVCGGLQRASRQLAQPAEALAATLADLAERVDGGEGEALPAYVAARQQFAAAAAASVADAQLRR